MVALRFYGSGWEKEDATRATRAAGVVFHEAFHFWNGELAVSHDANWLREGSAEYASLLLQFESGRLNAAEFTARLSGSLAECRKTLRGEPLNGPAGQDGQAPYACGTFIQWLAERAAPASRQGRRPFFAIWRQIVADARGRDGHLYTLDDFRRIAHLSDKASPFGRAVQLILYGKGTGRWDEIAAAGGLPDSDSAR